MDGWMEAGRQKSLFSLRHAECVPCARRSGGPEGQRRGTEDRRAVRERGGRRPHDGPDRHGGPHPVGGGQSHGHG